MKDLLYFHFIGLDYVKLLQLFSLYIYLLPVSCHYHDRKSITLTRNSRLLARLVHILFDLRVVVCDSFANGHESLDRQIYRLADSCDRSQTPVRA